MEEKPLFVRAGDFVRVKHKRSIAVLCGGLGGSRCVDALARAARGGAPAGGRVEMETEIAAIGNVGDDVEILGLHVSPDLDTVLYTLAGLLDEERGWGVRDETYSALSMAGALGAETWFTLGDRDIGLHLVRSRWLREGVPLSEATRRLTEALGVGVSLLPATDDPVSTMIATPEGELPFQDWYVGRRHADPVLRVRYEGAEAAEPAPGVLQALEEADVVVLAPSNPFVSIEPILAVPGLREAVAAKRVVALSPLVGGRALRGPLAEMLESMGHEASAAGVARLYGDLVDTWVLDPVDADLAAEIPGAVLLDIVMVEPERREDVGRALLEAVL